VRARPKRATPAISHSSRARAPGLRSPHGRRRVHPPRTTQGRRRAGARWPRTRPRFLHRRPERDARRLRLAGWSRRSQPCRPRGRGRDEQTMRSGSKHSSWDAVLASDQRWLSTIPSGPLIQRPASPARTDRSRCAWKPDPAGQPSRPARGDDHHLTRGTRRVHDRKARIWRVSRRRQSIGSGVSVGVGAAPA
jgi:hypothetical protein